MKNRQRTSALFISRILTHEYFRTPCGQGLFGNLVHRCVPFRRSAYFAYEIGDVRKMNGNE